MFNDCWLDFLGELLVEPGKSVEAKVTMVAPEFQLGRLYEGMSFGVHEGWHCIGSGEIITVLNPEFRRLPE